MPVRLIAANLRDLSYIASNLRPEDQAEAECQYDHWSPALLAAACLRDHSYCVEVNGNPEAAFGAQRMAHVGLWVAWSWMTRRGWRAVPAITAFVRTVMLPDLIAQGAWRCEARAMACHTSAHRWLIRMGATERCLLPCWGKNGEDFKLYDWTRDNVLCSPIRRGRETPGSDYPTRSASPDNRQRCGASTGTA